MTELLVGETLNAKDKVTSLEMLKQINLFRENEGITSGTIFVRLKHNDLLRVIRDEFSEEIGMGIISHTSYIHPQNGQSYPMFELSLKQARQIMMRESKFVRKSVLNWIEELEEALKAHQPKVPTNFREALLLAAEQQAVIEEQQKQLVEAAPKVLFASAVETSKKSCLIGELAKILKQNGINIGQKRLFAWLRDNNYLCKTGEAYNQPTQKSMELKLFEVKKTTINKPDGTVIITTTTKCTGKGQIYFVNKFLKK